MTWTPSGETTPTLDTDEARIVELLARNVSRDRIARELGCSTATLDRRVAGLRRRYGVETTTEVVVRAVRDGAI